MTAPQRRPEREPARAAASRRRGLERAHAARREARRLGAATGWHGRPDWRLTAFEADRIATELEAAGWRAEGVTLAQGVALVEVRDLAVRWHPLVATLRTRAEGDAFLGAHPARARRSPAAGAA